MPMYCMHFETEQEVKNAEFRILITIMRGKSRLKRDSPVKATDNRCSFQGNFETEKKLMTGNFDLWAWIDFFHPLVR